MVTLHSERRKRLGPFLFSSVRSALLNRLGRWEWLMSRTIALLVAIVVCGGCERESWIRPLDALLPTAPSRSGPTLVAAQIEGRVIDADHERPIPGALVTTVSVCYPGRCGNVDQPSSTVADGNGMFRLAANLPQDWKEVLLKVSNPGYEPTEMYLQSESAMNAVLRTYRVITIRAGESVQLRVLFQGTCGFEGIPCRPIHVESSDGESINLAVSPVEARDQFGVMVTFPFSTPPLESQLTVRGGPAWIVRSAASSGTGMATVVARR